MSIKAVQEALAKSHKDNFELGTVLKWTSGVKYVFAAIKTPVGWYTTSQSPRSPIAGILTFDELLDALSRPDATDVMVAQVWTPIGASEKAPYNDVLPCAGENKPPPDRSWLGDKALDDLKAAKMDTL